MSHEAKKPFILIDGSSYLYRAFHALPALANSRGEPTGAVYGVINMIRKLLAEYEPEHMAVVFDAKGKTFRDEFYPAYKATRPPMPVELRGQIEPLHRIIQAMGLPLLMVDGVEADDVIGTLACAAEQQGMDTLISTGDKDLAQLVNARISLINTMTGVVLDEAGVKEKFGVAPSQIVDYLSLIGDSSDNVPGIPGVGPKTAVKWLTLYPSLDQIVEHAEAIKGKVGDALRANLDQLALAKTLVTLKLDVSLDVGPQALCRKLPEQDALVALYQHQEFKGWLTEQLGEKEAPALDVVHELVLTEQDFDAWLSRLNEAPSFAFDTETNSLDCLSAEMIGLSFAVDTQRAAYVPFAHDYVGAPKQLSRDAVLAKLKPLLEDAEKTKVGQNLKFDASMLLNYDIHLQGNNFDTMLESYVVNSTASRHDMDSLALKYLGKKTTSFVEIAGKGKTQKTFNEIPLEEAGPYAAEDAAITLALHEAIWPALEAHDGLLSSFRDIEMPLVPVLMRMERAGVCVDAALLKKQGEEFAERIEVIESAVYEQAGETFNLASPKQLQAILFEKLKLPIIKKTAKGQPSTAEPILQELALNYPLPKLLLEYRSLSKLKSTYLDRLPEQMHPKTGRVHTSFNQAVTSTGRLSSSNPNLQNIPVRTQEGRRIRQAFIAPAGYRLVSADYSQVELRIMAHFSEDPGLLDAFARDLDVHSATAAEIFGVSLDAVTPEQRRRAKAVNFGLIYGMSAFGLARQLGVERSVAQEYIDLYFARYPGVHDYMQSTRNLARKQGYVETLFGHRVAVPEINASNMQRRMAAERAAINAPLQGTAADIIKRAMIPIDAWLQTGEVDARMVLQVHDELVLEVATPDVACVSEKIQDYMVNAASLSVALKVSLGDGQNWDEAH